MTNRERLLRYHSCLNALDLDGVEAMFAESADYDSIGIGVLKGRTAIMAAMRAYFADHPGQVAEDESVEELADGRVVARWRLTAPNIRTGEVSLRQGIETVTFDTAGLIVRVEVHG